MIFRDRTDGGRQLAGQLERYRARHPIVLGLTRGGVPVAAEVARGLSAKLVWERATDRVSARPGAARLAVTTGGRVLTDDVAGRYRVLKPLTDGGMATVYVSEDVESPGSRCALKIMAPRLLRDERLRRESACQVGEDDDERALFVLGA